MSETYEQGELFVYMNGDRWELGEVKRPNNTGDGYFCWYSTGDTAANTPTHCMHKLANSGWSHIEKLRKVEADNAKLRELCLDLWASCPVHDEDCQGCKHYDGAFCDLYVRIEELEVME